jgi:predicted alpha/beta-fold hydrolase
MTYEIKPFEPHPLLRGGHAQTLAGFLHPGRLPPYRAVQHRVELVDGDRIVLHDDQPDSWRPTDRSVLLIHGLAGCHSSGYVRRVAGRLNEAGYRTFRMDLRGCGAGETLARYIYHSGRSQDAAAALTAIAELCPQSPTTVIGFSLGGNITLKLLGEVGAEQLGNLDSGAAVCPPVDLTKCSNALSRPINAIYDRYFVRLLQRQIRVRRRQSPEVFHVDFPRRPRKLRDFDDYYTAKMGGFESALDYYHRCSSRHFLPKIQLPTLILAAHDDPMIPGHTFEDVSVSSSTHLALVNGGGHLGFIGRTGLDPDRRWMDWRLVEWVKHVDRRPSDPAKTAMTAGASQ